MNSKSLHSEICFIISSTILHWEAYYSNSNSETKIKLCLTMMKMILVWLKPLDSTAKNVVVFLTYTKDMNLKSFHGGICFIISSTIYCIEKPIIQIPRVKPR